MLRARPPPVITANHLCFSQLQQEAAEEEDNMEEIDLDNVIGRRTRGKVIDFAKAAQENPVDADDDEEDDEDFEIQEEVAVDDGDKMDED